VRAAFAEVTANARAYKPDAALTGVVVQAMAQPGVEMVVGVKQDAVFGPVVMVGLGGIFVEVLKDVVFRAAPVSDLEALDMLEELKGKAMLDGVRGRPAVDRHALAALISNVSIFAAAAGGRLQELDLNPVMVSEKGVTAVDVLMVLSEER
jgi:acetyltransferase